MGQMKAQICLHLHSDQVFPWPLKNEGICGYREYPKISNTKDSNKNVQAKRAEQQSDQDLHCLLFHKVFWKTTA